MNEVYKLNKDNKSLKSEVHKLQEELQRYRKADVKRSNSDPGSSESSSAQFPRGLNDGEHRPAPALAVRATPPIANEPQPSASYGDDLGIFDAPVARPAKPVKNVETVLVIDSDEVNPSSDLDFGVSLPGMGAFRKPPKALENKVRSFTWMMLESIC